MRIQRTIIYLFALLFYLSCTNDKTDLKFIEQEEGILLKDGDIPVYFYQVATKTVEGEYPRSDYFHPVYGINGEVLTEDSPEDHPYHRGIFWAWHQLFVNDYRIGDPWICTGIEGDVDNVDLQVEKNTATLHAEVNWIGISSENSENQKEKLVKELVKVTYVKTGADYIALEFDLQLVAQVEGVRIGGSEDKKGYGGFCPRIYLPEDVSFHSKSGSVVPLVTAVQAGNWVDIKGTFDKVGNRKSGFTIMMDPDFSKPFHGWILRKKGSMQNVAVPGREPMDLTKSKPLRLRYMILSHEYDWDNDQIEKIYQEFREGK